MGRGWMQVGVDLMLGVPLGHVREKSIELGRLFRQLIDLECFEWGFQLASPSNAEERGSQICFKHPEGYSIMQVGLMHISYTATSQCIPDLDASHMCCCGWSQGISGSKALLRSLGINISCS